MTITRRTLLAAAGAAPMLGICDSPMPTQTERRFEVCLSPEGLKADPELLRTVRDAGIYAVWLTGFLYGYWPYPIKATRAHAATARALGMEAHMVHVPLGHPGDSLGSMSGGVPLTPPRHWRMGMASSGAAFSGTSLHPPATAENEAALRVTAAEGFRKVFLDDDFRLAQSPGSIGGCFCGDHKRTWLEQHGYAEAQWSELMADIASRRLTRLVREWIDAACAELSGSYLAQRRAARPAQLGNMVMFMGSEQGGIRLADYRTELFRVGEGHFGDGEFSSPKGKMNELFSSLFHRRFAAPELAYSETTAYPATALSAANMAAKLTVSTISDVRTTCFMSGLTPFPKAHWAVLAPRMKHEAAIHGVLAGMRPAGPIKHWWGEAGRYVGNANPFSLALAIGVPFEVCSREPTEGWVFLGDHDAVHGPANAGGPARVAVARPGVQSRWIGARTVAESLPDLFRLKREILAGHPDCPYVQEERPATLAWYPEAGHALLWNLDEHTARLTIRHGDRSTPVEAPPLGSVLIPLGAPSKVKR
ncbi:MAG: hypothetical protein NT029_20175 [Armatimonadetes bacterium]|nr:hypothetical protein [Armatimonadota bacterium]